MKHAVHKGIHCTFLELQMIFNLLLASFLFSLSFAVKMVDSSFDAFGMTKLHNAILKEKAKEIEELIDAGVKTTTPAPYLSLPDLATNNTPLHLLVEKVATQAGAEQTRSVEFVKKLVNSKVNRTIQSDSGWTALNKAVYLASDLPDYPLGVVEILLKDCEGIDKFTNNQSALHLAATSRLKNNRAADLVNLLVKHCPDKLNYDAPNGNNWTALKVAIAADNMQVAAILKPRTSYLSFEMKITLAGLAILLVLLSGAIYVYFRYFKKPSTVEPVTSPKAQSETTSEISSELASEINEEIKEGKEKFN